MNHEVAWIFLFQIWFVQKKCKIHVGFLEIKLIKLGEMELEEQLQD